LHDVPVVSFEIDDREALAFVIIEMSSAVTTLPLEEAAGYERPPGQIRRNTKS